MDSTQKIGLEKLSAHKKSEMMKNYLSRKVLLVVPEDIVQANPDKHFVYINMNTLEKSGMYHPEGYRLYKTQVDSENQNKDRFNYSNDGLVHRNEMVLAYLPKEEFEERQLEREIFRSNRKNSDVITENDALRGFSPHAKVTTELVSAE